MRYLTLAGAAFAVLGFAMPAQADNHYGPRQQGNQCYIHQTGDSLGYWGACKERSQTARTNTNANNNRNANTASTRR